MKPCRQNLLAAVCVCLAVPVPAFAQPIFSHAVSVEAMVANADLVVVGRVVELTGSERADSPEARESREGALAVEETVKGEHRGRLRVRFTQPEAMLADWQDRSARLLVAAQGDPPAATTVIDLSADGLEVLTADFTVLRRPEEVLQAARETVRRMPGVRRIATFGLMVPREALAGTKWMEYHGTVLSIPVDDRLEQRAHEYIRSDSYSERHDGIRALRHFKSDENIERARSLLDDPGWAYLHRAEENRGLEVRIYTVRREAYRTLKSWGVTVEKPVVREETLKLERVRSVSLSNTEVAAEDLRDLERFENLESLFLWNTRISDADLKQVARLPKLRELYLAGTQVTDAGLKHLAELPDLEYLDLAGTRLTDEGLKALAGFRSLRKVDLGRARATDAGVAELRRLRPELDIE